MIENKNIAFKKAVELVGGQSHMAKKLGLTQQTIFCWLKTGLVPPKRALQIEKVLDGVVSRYELRPDIYPRDKF